MIVNLIHPLGYSPEYDSEIGSYTEQHGLPKPKYSSPRPYPPPQAHHRPGHPRYWNKQKTILTETYKQNVIDKLKL